MFGIIGWIFFGLVVGVLAKFLMPGRDPGGFFITILLGIGGSVLGGWTGAMLGMYKTGQPAGFLMSIVGAIVLLAIYRVVARPRAV